MRITILSAVPESESAVSQDSRVISVHVKLEKSRQCLPPPFSHVHRQGQLLTLLQTADQSPLRWPSPSLWPASAEVKADLHLRSGLTFLLSHGFPLFRRQGL